MLTCSLVLPPDCDSLSKTYDYVPPLLSSSVPVLIQADMAEQQLWPYKLFLLHYLWSDSLTQLSAFVDFIEDVYLDTFYPGVKMCLNK